MKVLMVSYGSLMQAHYHALPRELAKMPNVELTVVVPTCWRELWKKEKIFLEVTQGDGYSLEQVRVLFPGRLHFALFYGKIAELIRSLKPDILDVENEPFNLGSAQIIFLRNKYAPKSYITMHTSQNLFKSYPPPFNFIERYSYNHVCVFFARNHGAIDVLRRKGYKGKVSLITHGVDEEAFQSDKRKEIRKVLGITDEFLVGFIGAFTYQKGIDLLLKAIYPLDCKLLLIGDGNYKKELIAQIKSQNLERKVILHPPIQHREIPHFLSAIDTLILPSRTVKNVKEQFGRVLIEAMAAGIPVIGSSCGEIPTVIGDAGLVFPEEDWNALREQIQFLQFYPKQRQEYARKGFERATKEYSWKIISKKIYQHYLECLEKS